MGKNDKNGLPLGYCGVWLWKPLLGVLTGAGKTHGKVLICKAYSSHEYNES